MDHLERDLAEHLRHLSSYTGPDALSLCAGGTIGQYVGAVLADWGFAVERLVPAEGRGAASPWRLIGRLGFGSLGRVQLRARLDQQSGESRDPGLGGVAVLLALSHILAQHHLRYSLEVVIHCGPLERRPLVGEPSGVLPFGEGPALAAVCFDGPGQLAEPNVLAARGVSAALAAGARRLLARYPEVAWHEGGPSSCIYDGPVVLPGLWVGSGRPSTGLRPVYSSPRLREATMLGAEIVALLQSQTPSSCRPEGLAA